MDSQDPFAGLAPWQALLDRNRDALTSLQPGAAIGLLANGDMRAPVSQLRGTMMVWAATAAGMRASKRSFAGFQEAGVDLLLVLSDAALGHLIERIEGDPFPELSRDSGKGAVLIYYLKARDDLDDLGYEDFFAAVGLSFAGACR